MKSLQKNTATKFTIPIDKILLEFLIFLCFLVFLVNPLIITVILHFLGISDVANNLKGLLNLSMILTSAVGILTLFFFLPILMNYITYPVRKWILATIKCPKCENYFTQCEYAFQSTFANFVTECENCKKVYFVTSGFLDKTLRFESNEWLENIYEKKYFGNVYKVPFIVWVLNFLFMLLFTILPVIIILSVPVALLMLLMKFYQLDYTKVTILVIPLTLLGIWFIAPALRKNTFIKNFVDYPLKKWILKNTKCPECNNKFIQCDLEINTMLSNQYVVYCSHCEKNKKIGLKGYDWSLKFID